MAKVNLELNGKDNASPAVNNLTASVLKANIAFEALKQASTLIVDTGKKAIDEWRLEEKAVMALKSVVGENTEEFQKFAAELQSVTTVGGRSSLEIMQLGASMGIARENLNEATQNAIGLSKAFGIDLSTSMKMVAAANQGQYSMLQRYIPELKNAATDSDKLAIIQQKMASGFGMAKNELNTFNGQMESFKNVQGDVLVELGKIIAEVSGPFLDVIKGALTGFVNMDDGAKRFVVVLGALTAAIPLVVVGFNGIATGIRVVTAAMAANPFGAIVVGVLAVISVITALVAAFSRVKKSYDELNSTELAKRLQDDQKEFEKLGKMTGQTVMNLQALKKARQDALAGGMVKDEDLIHLNRQIQIAEEAQKIRAKINKERVQNERATVNEITSVAQSYQDKLFELENDKVTVLKKRMAQEIKEHGKTEAEKAAITQYYMKLIEDARLEMTSRELDVVSGFYGAMNTLISGLYQNEIDAAEEGSERKKQLQRDAFNANKALAIGNIILSTAQAITNALATPPAPVGIALAIVAGVMGAAQLAVAASQPMPAFAAGGTTPGGAVLVGERGPEIVDLPAGSRVHTADESRGMMSGISINGPVNIYPRNVEDFTRQLRQIARAEASRA